MSTAAMVFLKDGMQIDRLVVEVVMAKVKAIYSLDFFAFYHFVETCRNPLYQIKPNRLSDPKKILEEYKLMDMDGKVDAFVRSVILNAVEGKEFDMHFIDPIKKV